MIFLIIQFNNMNSAYKKVLFAISLFHAAINERTTYAHCGWNQVRILLLLTIFLFMKLYLNTKVISKMIQRQYNFRTTFLEKPIMTFACFTLKLRWTSLKKKWFQVLEPWDILYFHAHMVDAWRMNLISGLWRRFLTGKLEINVYTTFNILI